MTRTEEFEELRPFLFAIAYRILGSVAEEGREPGAWVELGQDVTQDSVHVSWLPPWLRISATGISTTDIRSHSDSTARCKPRRWYAGRAGGHIVCRRGYRRPRHGRWMARREPGWISSRAGISSPDAIRVNVVKSAISWGSELASPSLIESSARCSLVLRLIGDSSIAWL